MLLNINFRDFQRKEIQNRLSIPATVAAATAKVVNFILFSCFEYLTTVQGCSLVFKPSRRTFLEGYLSKWLMFYAMPCSRTAGYQGPTSLPTSLESSKCSTCKILNFTIRDFSFQLKGYCTKFLIFTKSEIFC